MQLSDAVEIKEVVGVTAVNEEVRNGWRVIASNPVTNPDLGKHDYQVVCYTLGKARTAEHQML